MAELLTRYRGGRITKAAQALADRLEQAEKPIVTPYELYLEYRQLYSLNTKLYLRTKTPNVQAFERVRRVLVKANILGPDKDYGYRAYRVLSIGDRSADEICCIVDPFCFISHMSAMQMYGISHRRPKALYLTRPSRKLQRELSKEKFQKDYKDVIPLHRDEYIPLTVVTHPRRVRGREISVFESANYGNYVKVRGANSRVASIGQTFLDTLQSPKLCGGMRHVLEVWQNHAKTYLEEIVDAVDRSDKPIVKIRAGFILEERLNFHNEKVSSWQRFAGRGSSRVLDPERSFAPKFSEKWMLSINV